MNSEFIRAGLQNRYDEVFNIWGHKAAESLWEQLLDFFDEVGVCPSHTPSIIVDNYLINGEFVDLSVDVEVENYGGLRWVKDNALILNDDYALIQF